jgi:mono/diheme cytochrome c family protein
VTLVARVHNTAARARAARATAARAAMAAILVLAAVSARPDTTTTAGIFGAGHLESTSGEVIYQQICQGCHMPDGRGASGAGRYPALAGDRALLSAQFMALTLIEGRRNMPAFGGKSQEGFSYIVPTLDDEQIAAVTNYVRTHFGNHFKGTISAAEVKALRRPH